jgi:hypothetical protein
MDRPTGGYHCPTDDKQHWRADDEFGFTDAPVSQTHKHPRDAQGAQAPDAELVKQ